MPVSPKNLALNRTLLLVAGATYMAWWFAVNALLPSAFNPFWGRFAVAFLFLALWAASFACGPVRRHLGLLLSAALWLLTAHFFYLFYHNGGDMNWVVGAFVTILAVSYCMTTVGSLLSYTGWVIALSALELALLPTIRLSIFFPGVLTILLQANVGLVVRNNMARRLHESMARERDLVHAAELQRIQTAAMQENLRTRDEFISLASHELKTPVTSLKLWTQMLERTLRSGQLPSPESVEKTTTLVQKQITRITKLVDTMLDVSRISTGRLLLDRSRVDLVPIARDVLASLELQAREAGTPLTLEAPATLELDGDATRLAQLVENLLSNAIKYGSRRPVLISLTLAEGFAEIRVLDHGVGIAPRDMARIFERFERVNSSGNISGLGLGLFLAKQIAEAHGGTLRAESRAGEGSVFIARLPVT